MPKTIITMKRFILMICVAMCAMTASAQQQTCQTKRDICYVVSENQYAAERCKLDVYYPQDTTGCPVVVWFHGGGLTGGNKYIPKPLRECGMVVVAVNYRLMPKVDIEECIDDAAAAVAWTFNHAEEYGGDVRKIFVAGHSAGGYLTSMIGLDKTWLAKYDIDADSIAALAPFSGQAITHFGYRQQHGIEATRPTIDSLAPLYHVRGDAPPLIIISGDRELELYGRYEEQAYFWRMMKLNGHTETYLYELDGFNHGKMATPAFHILKNHIAAIVEKSGGKSE